MTQSGLCFWRIAWAAQWRVTVSGERQQKPEPGCEPVVAQAGVEGSERVLCGVWGYLKHRLGPERAPAFRPGVQGARGAGHAGAVGEKAGSPILHAGEDGGAERGLDYPLWTCSFPWNGASKSCTPVCRGVSWSWTCSPPMGTHRPPHRPGSQAGQGGRVARTGLCTQSSVLISPPVGEGMRRWVVGWPRLTMALFGCGCCKCQ